MRLGESHFAICSSLCLVLVVLLATSSSLRLFSTEIISPKKPQPIFDARVVSKQISTQPVSLDRIRIVAIEPIFTTTAYASFYSFFAKYSTVSPGGFVKADLDLLNKSVVHSWGFSDGLRQFLASDAVSQYNLTLGKSLQILDDSDVTRGRLFFENGSRSFDVAILGFSEYATAQEYDNYKKFVKDGGVLILMDATNFLVEVEYYPSTDHLSLVKGHGWGFNGSAAWPDVFDRWKTDDTDWVGSSYGTSLLHHLGLVVTVVNNPIGGSLREEFGSEVLNSYPDQEENFITNLTGTSVIASWLEPVRPGNIVAGYLHRYGNSYVIHIGIMGSRIVAVNSFTQKFLLRSLFFAANSKTSSMKVSYFENPSSVSFQANPPTGVIISDSTSYSNGQRGNYTYGAISLLAIPFANYVFSGWSTSGGVGITDPNVNPTTVIVTGSGTITANFAFIPSILSTPLIIMLVAPLSPSILLFRGMQRRRKG